MVKIDIETLEEIKNLIIEEEWCIDKSVIMEKEWYIDKSAGMDCDYYEPLDNEYKNILLYLVCEEIDRTKQFTNYHL